MNAALRAFGPDAACTWTHENAGLGQCLMRFTPEDMFEKQPLTGAAGNHVLVSDGRIDNRPELIDELGISRGEAAYMPDSAFILRAYEKWGLDCPSHLVGSFAFAVYDLLERRMLIARSPIGERPLCYHSRAGIFAFATAPRGLFALPFIPREIDQRSLADDLVRAPEEPGSTLFSGIGSVRPGYSLVVRKEGITQTRFWRLDPGREIRFSRDDDYVDAFNTLFGRVVRDNLRSLTPVGISMSGGLDSSSLAAVAAPLLGREGKRLAAFTEVPREGFAEELPQGQYADETPYVQAMARMHSNLDLNLIRMGGTFITEGIEDFFGSTEAPPGNATNRVWVEAMLRESRSRSIRVMLTGFWGNFTISQDGRGLLPHLIGTGRWTEAIREARSLGRATAQSTLRVVAGSGVAPLLPAPFWLAGQRLRFTGNPIYFFSRPWEAYSAIRPEFAAAHGVEERARQKGHDFRFRPIRGVPSSRSGMRSAELMARIGSGFEARFGVQWRHVAGDMRLFEFCLGVPEDQYLRNGVSRWLIRRAMADRLPPEVLANRQRGLQGADWFARLRGTRGRIADELKSLERCKLAAHALDLPRMRGLLEAMPGGGHQSNRILRDYRQVLELGLVTGRFLSWFESGA